MTQTLRTSVVLLCGVLAVSASAIAQRGAKPAAAAGNAGEATARVVAAAQALVSTLDEAGRAKVQFPFEGQQKTRWSNLPTGIFKREGLRMGDLTPPQRAAVTTLLQAALSADGYRKVTEIIRGDEVLRTGAAPAAAGPVGRGQGAAGRRWAGRRGARRGGAGELVRRVAAAGRAAVAAGRTSARRVLPGLSGRRRRRPRGCCSSAAITWRST